MIEKDKLMEFTEAEDSFLDFCLWEYQPNTSLANKFRSVNLLFYSFEIAGVDDKMFEICKSIRQSIGDWRTVWGVKQVGNNLSWEFYFYDYNRLLRDVSISKALEVFRSFTNCELNINEDCLYFMFSIDIDNDLVTGRRDLNEINVYLGDVSDHVSAGICYMLNENGLRLDNLYHFFDAETEMDQIADKVLSSLHLTLSDFNISRILMPEFIDCKTIVVANKKYNDGIYFSRIKVEQLIIFLKMMKYPHELVELVQTNQAKLNHLLYDVGIDYKMKDGNLELLKGSFYGVF